MAFGQCRRPPVDPAPVDLGPRPCRPIAAMALLGLQLLRACNRRRQGLQERAPGTGRARGLQRDGGHRLQWQGPGPAAGAATAGPESGSGSGTAMAERGPATGGRQRVRLQLPGLQWQSVGLQGGGRQRLCLQLQWQSLGPAMGVPGACNGRPAPARPCRGPGGPKPLSCRIREAGN